MVGGSALIALGLISRATRDVDVLALVEGQKLVSADPLPGAPLDAARTVARDFGLGEDWLNSGATSPLAAGLPDGFQERAEPGATAPGLEVLFVSRRDQIHLKLYATVDDGAGNPGVVGGGRARPAEPRKGPPTAATTLPRSQLCRARCVGRPPLRASLEASNAISPVYGGLVNG